MSMHHQFEFRRMINEFRRNRNIAKFFFEVFDNNKNSHKLTWHLNKAWIKLDTFGLSVGFTIMLIINCFSLQKCSMLCRQSWSNLIQLGSCRRFMLKKSLSTAQAKNSACTSEGGNLYVPADWKSSSPTGTTQTSQSIINLKSREDDKQNSRKETYSTPATGTPYRFEKFMRSFACFGGLAFNKISKNGSASISSFFTSPGTTCMMPSCSRKCQCVAQFKLQSWLKSPKEMTYKATDGTKLNLCLIFSRNDWMLLVGLRNWCQAKQQQQVMNSNKSSFA